MKKQSFKPQRRIEGEFKDLSDDAWKDVKLVLDRLRKKLSDVDSEVTGLNSRDTFLSALELEKLNGALQSDSLTSELVASLLLNYGDPSQIAEHFVQYILRDDSLSKERIRDLYESNEDVNRFNDELRAKLIRLSDLTPGEIKQLYESNENTNAFTDDYKLILDNLTEEKYLYQEFASPSGLWTIDHNFGFRPAVDVFDVDGREMEALVEHPTVNRTTVRHDINTAGSVVLS